MIDSLYKRVSDTEDEGIMRYNDVYLETIRMNIYNSLSLSLSYSSLWVQGDIFYAFLYSEFKVLNFRELLLDFYTSSGKQKPDQIIIFRYF